MDGLTLLERLLLRSDVVGRSQMRKDLVVDDERS
jgi:hypothetical protein